MAVPKSGNINNEILVHYITWQQVNANLGWIEKNMLITPEVGVRVNWGTVLTDAPLNVISPDI